MPVKIAYLLNAELADGALNAMRGTAHEKYKKEVAKALAYRDGYIQAIMDVQDRLIDYQLTEVRKDD